MEKIGKRLKELRKLYKFTLKEVGEKLGVDISLVSRWENDERSPNQQQLVDLAKLFEVSFNFLILGDELKQINFRTQLPKESDEYKALVKVYLQANENVVNIRKLIKKTKSKVSTIHPSYKVESIEDIPDVVREVRDFYKLNKILSYDELKEALREKDVFVFEWHMPNKISGFTVLQDIKVIYLNRLHTIERKLFTLAHELAHILLHGDSETSSFETNLARRSKAEKEANIFASELILSEKRLRKLLAKYGERFKNPSFLRSAARVYNVSPDSMFYRLQKIGFFKPWEKVNYIKPFKQSEDKNEYRVTDIESEVDSSYFARLYSEYIDDEISFGKFRDLLFTDDISLKNYLENIDSLFEDTSGEVHH